MKQTVKIIAVLIIGILCFTSCQNIIESNEQSDELTQPERVILGNIALQIGNMGDKIADVDLRAVTELANQYILGEVTELKNVTCDSAGIVNFTYIINVKKVYFSSGEQVTEGSDITVMSTAGIMKANEIKKRIGSSPRMQKFGIMNGDFADNEYFVSSLHSEIPIEVGKEYILYLTDKFYGNYKLYVANGYGNCYEYTDGVLYSSTDRVKSDMSFEQLERELEQQARDRTGIVDRIGSGEYLIELGKQQQAARKNSD